eukprot:SM000018S03725  [mRNA]  locus=s18:1163535:1164249:+ [translate_table: standard]
MVVVLPNQALEAFRGATGGLLGLMSNLPGDVGTAVARAVNKRLLRAAGHLAWPNRWAGEQVVPELVGDVGPEQVGQVVAELLTDAPRIEHMRRRLQALTMTQPESSSASALIAEQVASLLQINGISVA